MASENSALWGSLVKAMTRKIDVPGFSGQHQALRPEDLRPEPSDEGSSGRRVGDRPPPAPRTRSAESPEKAVERIAAHLNYLSRKVVEDYLESHGSAGGVLGRRLAALGLARRTNTSGASFWWSVLSSGEVDPETLAEILRACPGIPEHHDRNGLLFDYVLDSEIGSYREVKAADKQAFKEGKRLLSALVENETLTEGRAADVTAEFFGLRRKRGSKWVSDPTLGSTVTPEIGHAFQVVPVSNGSQVALLSVSHPGAALVETLKKVTGHEVEILIDTPSSFAEVLADWEKAVEAAALARPAGRSNSGRMRAPRERTRPRKGTGEFRIDQDSFLGINSPPDMARALMERATAVGATDIHLEPQREGMRARFRLDGILYNVAQLRGLMGEEVLSRVKVMADMDITERRKPQDGHIRVELHGDAYDFRIATVPTTHGERMSIRITAGAKEVPTLDLLNLDAEEDEKLHDFTRRSHGIVLACGPVGSGKTTTLYACLGEVDADQKNIMTIEDPVEIALPHVSQINVNYKIGLDFAKGLRALMRQDPNIILVGEIRDEETAKVAVRASLTGLLVLSTIHANSATGAVTTLYNFNIAPFLLATSLVGVVAQRLVRTICSECREVFEPEPQTLNQAGLTDEWLTANGYLVEVAAEPAPEPAEGEKPKRRRKKKPVVQRPVFHRGRGCDACFGTGYLGRRGIFEILDVTDDMRLAISERKPESLLKQMALDSGMRTLADAGRHRVVSGETTVEEFVRVLYQ
ncbi:MAG: type II/IV secretion system protein [Deltaproteobacteria bacterium]|nr:type II/IV secretion system protein [Deltaproteobacteria bacterium]